MTRGDQLRTVTVEFLIEDATPEHADEFVANLQGVVVEALVPSEGGMFGGEIVKAAQERDKPEPDGK